MVTAKFKVTRATRLGAVYDKATDTYDGPGYGTELEMTPDYAGGKNSDWSAATPSGIIRLTITNEAAIDALPVGASLDVTFTVVDE